MVVPFMSGTNEFQIHDAAINGPMLGATARGQIDFAHETARTFRDLRSVLWP